MALSAHLSRLASTLRDPSSRTSQEQRRAAFDDAVICYSKDKPRRVIVDTVMASPNTISAPAEWVAGWSKVESVEVPLGQIPPQMIDPSRFYIAETPSGDVITLLDGQAVNAPVRLVHTTRHVCDETLDTIPFDDAEAVACWAAAVLADQIAASYSDASAPTISADRIDQTNPAREWAKRATSFRARYAALLRVDDAEVRAAGTVVNLDTSDSLGNRWQTHWRNR